jgi:hypothetical protein
MKNKYLLFHLIMFVFFAFSGKAQAPTNKTGARGTMRSLPSNHRLDVKAMPFIHKVDERFMSFQIGMSHLTGGETWTTFDSTKKEGAAEQAKDFNGY